MKTNIKFIFALLAGVVMTACSYNPPAESDLFYEDNEATIESLTADGKLYTLQELKDSFMTEQGNYYDPTIENFYRTRGHLAGDKYWYYSIDTFPAGGPGIYIVGRICTDDTGGNYYKTIVLQQIVDGEQQNLRVGVDIGSVGGYFPQGQKVLIRCNGLAIGKYSNQPQLCSPSYNNNIYANKASEKAGWQPGRIPGPQFFQVIKRIGTPSLDSLYYEELTVSQLWQKYITPYSTDPEACRRYDGRLVRIKDVHFTGEYESDEKDGGNYKATFVALNAYVARADSAGNPAKDPNANVFAPTTENNLYPQTRCITDAQGNQRVKVGCSEFAKYSHYFLPSHITRKEQYESGECALDFNYAACVGHVQGIFGYYVDKASVMTSNYDAVKPYYWSITPCGLNDLSFTDTISGKAWGPVEFSKDLFGE